MSVITVFPFLALLCVSSSFLAYELILMRLFSIVQWYHFAYMVISIALLGLAASGTVLAIIQRKAKGSIEEYYSRLFPLISFSLFLFMMISFYLAKMIPFSPFQLVWQKQQYIYLTGYYLLFFVPFFLGGCFIGLNFICFKDNIAQVYFFNLLGSGIGVAIAFLSFYIVPPSLLLTVSSFFALLGFLFSTLITPRRKPYLMINAGCVLSLLIYLITGGIPLEISPYKGISKSLQLPGARLEYEKYSPLGLVQVVDAPSLRYAPGLSLAYSKGPPAQKELFIDGNSYGAVTNFEGNRSKLEYLDYSTTALAYNVVFPESVLILNPGGGSQILTALYYRTNHIQAVEPHPDIVNLLRGSLRSFSQNIYCRHPNIKVDTASCREFIARASGPYDLIQLGLVGSWGGLGGGIYAVGENYIYTTEAFHEYMKLLKYNGIISASAWLSSPPRTFLKLLALAVETVDKISKDGDSCSIAAIRSWGTGTVLIKKGEFELQELNKIRDFCKERAFDLVYYPGIDQRGINQYSILEKPIYYETITVLLDSNKRNEFYKNYVFNIKPPTDDRPYFFHFFKLSTLSYLIKTMGKEWIPFMEWGSVILWGTLAQALLLSLLFLFLPLVFIREKERRSSLGKGRIAVYFSLLGLGFMFIEMGYIQKFLLLLTHPIFALALVLITVLVFSGMGSLLSRMVWDRARWIPFAGIIFFCSIYVVFLDDLMKFFVTYSLLLKCVIVFFLLAPLAFFMGMPFPIGLQIVSERQSNYIPWVWGINGVASVIAPILGSLLSIYLGFRIVMLVSIFLYGLAGWVIHLINQKD